MSIYGAILPGAARVARLPAEVHPEALRRWKVVHWCRQHGNQVRLTARYFGFSPDTVSRWVHAFEARGMAGLRPGSRRPKRVRQPQTPAAGCAAHPGAAGAASVLGTGEAAGLLAKEGIELSAKSIDRGLSRLRKRGPLFEPLPVRQAAARRQRSRPRRPPDLVVDGPGVLVQFDSKHVVAPQGRVFYEFGAIDCFSRQRVVELFARQDSRAGAEFLERVVDKFPFPIQAIQTDGGSEFLGQFGPKVQQLRLVQYWNGPNYPQGNGRIERSFGTDEREFWQIAELPNDLAGLRAALADWNRVYHSPFNETSVWAVMIGRGTLPLSCYSELGSLPWRSTSTVRCTGSSLAEVDDR